MGPELSMAGEQRLHPMSWLFVLLTALRQFVLPLIVLLVFGKGDTWEFYAALGALGVAAYSVIYSFGFRYRIADGELVIREGIFDRTERHIPFARIQNVVQKQNLLHRLFHVTELQLESAGGIKPEASMSVLRKADAAALEAILRGHQNESVPNGSGLAQTDVELHRMSTPEVLRLGLISNRGMIVVGSLIAAWFQLSDESSSNFFIAMGRQGKRLVGELAPTDHPVATVLAVLGLILAALVALRLLSVVLALLQFHGFRLTSHGVRLSTEAGLLSRVKASARRDRIQMIDRHSSLLSRWMRRESIKVDVAGGGATAGEEHSRLKWIAPLADHPKADALLREIAPDLDLERLPWRPLHPRAWIRKARWGAGFWIVIALANAWFFPMALGLLLLAAWAIVAARGWANYSRYAITDRHLAWRSGWLTRHILVLPLDRVQVVATKSSWFDRKAGMATLDVDTMSADPLGQHMTIPYLPAAQARALAVILGRHAAAGDHPPRRPTNLGGTPTETLAAG